MSKTAQYRFWLILLIVLVCYVRASGYAFRNTEFGSFYSLFWYIMFVLPAGYLEIQILVVNKPLGIISGYYVKAWCSNNPELGEGRAFRPKRQKCTLFKKQFYIGFYEICDNSCQIKV